MVVVVVVVRMIGRFVLGRGIFGIASAPVGQVELKQELVDIGQQSAASHGCGIVCLVIQWNVYCNVHCVTQRVGVL